MSEMNEATNKSQLDQEVWRVLIPLCLFCFLVFYPLFSRGASSSGDKIPAEIINLPDHYTDFFDEKQLSPNIETKGTIAWIRCRKNQSEATRIGVGLPANAKIVAIRAYMRNSSWAPGNQPCRSDLGSAEWRQCPIDSGECPIGWSKVRNLRINKTSTSISVGADFYTWRHDNHRHGKFQVDYIIE